MAGERRELDWSDSTLSPGLTSRQAAQVGTAGYTAMLCVQALERAGITPQSGKVREQYTDFVIIIRKLSLLQ